MAYKVSFTNQNEIRMGSPFNVASPIITGAFVPSMGRRDFQDLALVSSPGSVCYLIEWQIEGNDPGFRVIRLDENSRSQALSHRIHGCAKAIAELPDGEGVRVTVWLGHRKEAEIEIREFLSM